MQIQDYKIGSNTFDLENNFIFLTIFKRNPKFFIFYIEYHNVQVDIAK